jgi:hypothetical protein
LEEAPFRWRAKFCSLRLGVQNNAARDRLPSRWITNDETITGENEDRLGKAQSSNRFFAREQFTSIEQKNPGRETRAATMHLHHGSVLERTRRQEGTVRSFDQSVDRAARFRGSDCREHAAAGNFVGMEIGKVEGRARAG